MIADSLVSALLSPDAPWRGKGCRVLPAGAHARPLSPEELAVYGQLLAGLHTEGQSYLDGRGREWFLGDFCRRSRDCGLWLRDPHHEYLDFLHYICAVTGIRCKRTLNRRIQLADGYSQDEYLRYARRDVPMSVLLEIAPVADPRLRAPLLNLAEEGGTVAQVLAARRAGLKELERLGDLEDIDSLLTARVLQASIAARNAQRKNGPRPAPCPQGPAPVPDGSREQELVAWEARLREQQQALERERAALHQAAPDPRLLSDLAEREARLEQREEFLFTAQDRLDAREQELELRALELDTRTEELKHREKEVERKILHLEQTALATGAGEFRWPSHPQSLDSSVLYLSDQLDHLAGIAEYALEHFVRPPQDPQVLQRPGGIALVGELSRCAHMANDLVFELARETGAAYLEQDRERSLEEMREWEENRTDQPAYAEPPAEPDYHDDPGFALPVEVIAGTGNRKTPQRGVLATTLDGKRLVLLDLNRPQVINISGIQDSGKSNTVQATLEMLLGPIENVSRVQKEAAGLICHYGNSHYDYPPGTALAMEPNDEPHGVRMLDTIGARPQGLRRKQLIFVPPMSAEELAERRRQFPGCVVKVLELSLDDLDVRNMRLLLGAHENSALYLGRLDEILRRLPRGSTLEDLEQAIRSAGFEAKALRLLDERLARIRRFVPGTRGAGEPVEPGMLVTLDLRTDDMSEQEAMALFAVMMNLFARARTRDGKNFPKVVVFDEAHKYMGKKSGISRQILGLIREMRHRLTWVIVASQDPQSVPETVNELSTVTLTHRMRSKEGHRALCRGNQGWDNVTVEMLSALEQGEVYALMAEATEEAYRTVPQRFKVRATCSRPGGTTLTAVEEGP